MGGFQTSRSKPEPIADAQRGDPESTTFTEGLVGPEVRQADDLARAFHYAEAADNDRLSNVNDHISSLYLRYDNYERVH